MTLTHLDTRLLSNLDTQQPRSVWGTDDDRAAMKSMYERDLVAVRGLDWMLTELGRIAVAEGGGHEMRTRNGFTG